MASASGSLDYWRKFFRSTDSDIIDVIECAILVATSDCPKELRSRRDQITEKLYACRVPGCFGCDRAELQSDGADEVDCSAQREGEKESKAGSSSDGAEELNPVVSNYSYNDAEALTDEIEEESQIVEEVLRIKKVLVNQQDESDNFLFESLRRLQLMALSVETLKATDIGRAVNGLRRHNSKPIRNLVRTLVEDWKVLVDEWISATAVVADESPALVNPTDVDEEEGLPSPPLDEGALWATQTTTIQLSEFFSGMDDDGNFRPNNEVHKNPENRRMPPENLEPVRKQQIPEEKGQMRRHESSIRQTNSLERGELRRQEPVCRQTMPQIIAKEEMRRQEPVVRQRKPLDAPNGQAMPRAISNDLGKHTSTDSGPGRPSKPSSEMKASGEINVGVQKKSSLSTQDSIKHSKHALVDSGPGRPSKVSMEKKSSGEMNTGVQRKPPTALQDKLRNSEEASIRAKLEIAKRKLHENYQQAENAKKQRTIQVMELHDIPKKAHINRHPISKPKSHLRNLVNGRR